MQAAVRRARASTTIHTLIERGVQLLLLGQKTVRGGPLLAIHWAGVQLESEALGKPMVAQDAADRDDLLLIDSAANSNPPGSLEMKFDSDGSLQNAAKQCQGPRILGGDATVGSLAAKHAHGLADLLDETGGIFCFRLLPLLLPADEATSLVHVAGESPPAATLHVAGTQSRPGLRNAAWRKVQTLGLAAKSHGPNGGIRVVTLQLPRDPARGESEEVGQFEPKRHRSLAQRGHHHELRLLDGELEVGPMLQELRPRKETEDSASPKSLDVVSETHERRLLGRPRSHISVLIVLAALASLAALAARLRGESHEALNRLEDTVDLGLMAPSPSPRGVPKRLLVKEAYTPPALKKQRVTRSKLPLRS
eukprot:3241736-Prymnesium_polylepis.1